MTTVRTENHDTGAPRQDAAATDRPARKVFVEPKISSPIDVLEATTFFQAVDSGDTGLRRPRGD
jgi:hypothetical protein